MIAAPATGLPPARWLRVALGLLVAQSLALALQAVLLLDKERELLVGITVSRLGVDADELRAQVDRDRAIGLLLAESKGLPRLMVRQQAADPLIESIQVFDADAQRGFSAGVDRPPPTPAQAAAIVGSAAPAAPVASAPTSGLWFDAKYIESGGRLLVGRSLGAADDGPGAGVLYTLNAKRLAERLAASRRAMLPRLGLTVAVLAVALPLLLRITARRAAQRGFLRRRLLVLALGLASLSSFALSWQTLPGFEAQIAPALRAKADRVAAGLAGRISRAVALGIPVDRLNGVQSYLDESLARQPELVSLQLLAPATRFEARRPGIMGQRVAATVVDRAGHQVAEVVAEVDASVAARELRSALIDIGIVFLVAVLLFNEVLGAVLAGADLRGPHDAAGVQPALLGHARLAVFMLILAEELTRAFLPMHIAGLHGHGALSAGTAIGLPIAAYMASFALLTPFAGDWATRFGPGRVFALGGLLSAAGFAAVLGVDSYPAFVIARCLCAAGYAVGTMAMQQHVLHATGEADRARSLALLVSAVQTAAICGAPLGGLLAQAFGFGSVFAAAALLSLAASTVFAAGGPIVKAAGPHGEAAGPPAPRQHPLARLLPLLRRQAVQVSLLGAALPVKLVLAGFLFYLVPIALGREGWASAAIGRAMLLYFLLVALSNPIASGWTDRFGWQRGLVSAGGAVVGVGGLAGLAWTAGWLGGPAAILIGIAALGLGTGLSTAALQARLAREGPSGVVLLRTVERLGAVVGPLLAGSLASTLGDGGVMAAMGSVMLIATLGFALASRDRRNR